MTYAEHDLTALIDRVYVATGVSITQTDAAHELDRIRATYSPEVPEMVARMADDYFQPVDP